jgi:prolyl-tRNA editing enzyme YbaK/EbsC (Cys-tRNA(Pro) deacylase)
MQRRSLQRSVADGVSQANGGVPPFGHTTHLRVFIDLDLLQYDEVWAAAGTWHDVFGIEPHKLVEASEGLVTDLKRG